MPLMNSPKKPRTSLPIRAKIAMALALSEHRSF